MSQVPNKSTVTYVCTVAPTDFQALVSAGFVEASGVQGAISSALASMGLTVRSAQNDSGILGITFWTNPITFTMQVEVDTGFDYGSENDVAALINHGVYEALGVMPSSFSIPRFTLPPGGGAGSGGTVNTGQPGSSSNAGAAPSGCIAGSSNDLSGSFSLACWFSNLTSKGLSTVGLLAIAVVVGIAVFVFAPRPRVSVG